MFLLSLFFLAAEANVMHSLEKEASRRASPWRMLEHPWMIEMRAKRVNMSHFLGEVWGCPSQSILLQKTYFLLGSS